MFPIRFFCEKNSYQSFSFFSYYEKFMFDQKRNETQHVVSKHETSCISTCRKIYEINSYEYYADLAFILNYI